MPARGHGRPARATRSSARVLVGLLELGDPQLLLELREPARLSGPRIGIPELWVDDDVVGAPRGAKAPAQAKAHAAPATCSQAAKSNRSTTKAPANAKATTYAGTKAHARSNECLATHSKDRCGFPHVVLATAVGALPTHPSVTSDP